MAFLTENAWAAWCTSVDFRKDWECLSFGIIYIRDNNYRRWIFLACTHLQRWLKKILHCHLKAHRHCQKHWKKAHMHWKKAHMHWKKAHQHWENTHSSILVGLPFPSSVCTSIKHCFITLLLLCTYYIPVSFLEVVSHWNTDHNATTALQHSNVCPAKYHIFQIVVDVQKNLQHNRYLDMAGISLCSSYCKKFSLLERSGTLVVSSLSLPVSATPLKALQVLQV